MAVTVNQQLAETEKAFEAKLKVIKDEYQRNRANLESKKAHLELTIREYEKLLVADVELAITIAQFEEVLNTMRMKRNPSARL
jgi:hypothetical protein